MARCWRFLVGVWGLVLLGIGAGSVHAAVRLAVLSPDDNEHARQLVDLAIVEASRLPEVEVLDRGAAWERLQEEQLAQLGWLNGETSIVLGRRLDVDVFARVETVSGGREAIGLVAFDVGTGVRLWDATLPSGQLDEQVAAIVEGVTAAIRKRSALAEGVRAISFGSVRNVDLPRTEDSALDGVARLVERRLNTAANLVVLERRRLEWLNEEQTDMLPGERERIRSAVVMADVEFMSDSAGREPAMRIQLTSSQGESVGTLVLPASLADMAGVADHMAAGICSLMDGGCVDAVPDRRREAAHFAAEARHALGHHQYEIALRAAEAAHALAPEDGEIAGLLVEILFVSARKKLDSQYSLSALPGPRREGRLMALHRAQRASRLVGQHLDQMVPPPNLYRRNSHPVVNQTTESEFSHFIYTAFRNGVYGDPVLQNLLTELQRQAREMLNEQFRRYFRVVDSESAFRNFTKWVGNVPLHYGSVCRSTSAEMLDDLIWMMEQWLKLAEHNRLGNDRYGSPSRLFQNIEQRTNQFWISPNFSLSDAPGAGWSYGKGEYQRLEDFFGDMERHANPVVRLYGLRGGLWARQQWNPMGREALAEQVAGIREAGREMLAEEIPADSRGERVLAYRALLAGIAFLPDRAGRVREQMALFDLMLDHGDLMPEVVQTLGGWLDGDAGAEAAWRGIQRVRQGLEEGSMQVLWGREGVLSADLWRIEKALQAKDVIPKDTALTLDTRLLFGAAQVDGLQYISPPVLKGGEVWVAGILKPGKREGEELALYHVTVETGILRLLSKTGIKTSCCIHSLGRPSRGNGFWAVPTAQDGVVVLFDDGRPAVHLRQADGLPSADIHSVLAAEDRLFIGSGATRREGYLVVHDLKSGETETLCSSLRKTGDSPLDNVVPPYRVELVDWDEPKRRILFLVHFGFGNHMQRHPARGLWAYSPDDRSWNRLQEFYNGIPRARRLEDGQYFLDSSRIVCRFDPERDIVRFLYSATADSAGPGLTPTTAQMALEHYARGPYTLLDGDLWAFHPFSRLSSDGRKQTYYSLSGEIEYPRYPQWGCLETMETPRGLIYANPKGVWLIKPPGPDQPEPQTGLDGTSS